MYINKIWFKEMKDIMMINEVNYNIVVLIPPIKVTDDVYKGITNEYKLIASKYTNIVSEQEINDCYYKNGIYIFYNKDEIINYYEKYTFLPYNEQNSMNLFRYRKGALQYFKKMLGKRDNINFRLDMEDEMPSNIIGVMENCEIL